MTSLCKTKLCDLCPYQQICGGCPGCDRIYIHDHQCQKCLLTCVDKPGVLAAAHNEWDRLQWPRPTQAHKGIPGLPEIIHTVGSISKAPVEWEAWLPTIYKNKRPDRSASASRFVAVHGYSPDGYLADLWAHRADYWAYYRQFDLVFTPNFSIYDNAPRFEQLINLYRTTKCYAEMVNAGLPAILDVAWGQSADIERWVEYIRAIHPPAIAMSLQGIGGVKQSKDWIMVTIGYASILKRIPADIEVIFVGVASKYRANTVRAITGRDDLHWMTTFAYMYSRYGRLWDGRKASSELTRDEIFQLSTREMSLCPKDGIPQPTTA
ncbi:hypothetical protein CEB3_c18920 [Peptococcaceae bacterium CEB3]|nr:hypothetical protein CEB3_c18920 [Peptococcaceae bacterium CEB3]